MNDAHKLRGPAFVARDSSHRHPYALENVHGFLVMLAKTSWKVGATMPTQSPNVTREHVLIALTGALNKQSFKEKAPKTAVREVTPSRHVTSSKLKQHQNNSHRSKRFVRIVALSGGVDE